MKFLVDESVEFPVVIFLRENKFDTVAVAEGYSGLKDANVLALAVTEKRIVITNDKDFGELIFKYKLPHKGVVLIRAAEENSKSKMAILKSLLEKYARKLPNKFVVVTDKKVRFAANNI